MGETTGEMSRRGHDGEGGQDRAPASVSAQGAKEETAEIRAAIEQTRAEMSETVNAIQAQLSPEHLKDQAKERAREATVGRVQQVASRARETATRVREAAAGTAEEVASQARERTRAMVQRAPDTTKGAGSTIVKRIELYPIPVALTALVLGGLILSLRMRKPPGMRASSS